jgi:hypothetical protein
MSATVQRERRATAGKRMTSLVGKALEKDESFWNHETWAKGGAGGDDGSDSGNDSFRESDEDSELRQDEFDSDFNDSESDHEQEEQAEGEEEERQMNRDARKKRASQRPQIAGDIHIAKAAAGRAALLQKTQMAQTKGGPGLKGVFKSKRVVGVGDNAGIVLNIPGPVGGAGADASLTAATGGGQMTMGMSMSMAAASSKIAHKAKSSAASSTMVTTRPRRATGLSKYSSRFRAARSDVRTLAETKAAAAGVGMTVEEHSTKSTTRKSKLPTKTNNAAAGHGTATTTGTRTKKGEKRKRYSQEELLLEAVNDTEPSNDRWILARKRNRDQNEKDNETPGREARGKIIERISSRRGYLNTVTFPEMDHVPDILVAKQASPPQSGSAARSKQQSGPIVTACVITGQRGRYRDPRTGLPYYDAVAFRELRRRHTEGEPLTEQQRKRAALAAAAAAAAAAKKKEAAAKAAATAAAKAKSKAPPTIVSSMNGSVEQQATTAKVQVDAVTANELTKQQAVGVAAAPVAAASAGSAAPVAPAARAGVVAPAARAGVAAVPAAVPAASAVPAVPAPATAKTEAVVGPPKIKESTNVTAERISPTIAPSNLSDPPSSPVPRIVTSNSSPTKGVAVDEGIPNACPSPSQPAERKESMGASSAVSSNSRRASPRRRKPSAKVLENMPDMPDMPMEGTVVTVPGPANGSAHATTTLTPAPVAAAAPVPPAAAPVPAPAPAAKVAVSPTINGNHGKTGTSTSTTIDTNSTTLLDAVADKTDKKTTATDVAVVESATQKSTDKLASKEEQSQSLTVTDANKVPDA